MQNRARSIEVRRVGGAKGLREDLLEKTPCRLRPREAGSGAASWEDAAGSEPKVAGMSKIFQPRWEARGPPRARLSEEGQ